MSRARELNAQGTAQVDGETEQHPANITPLPVEPMRIYPMSTGMTEEDIRARIAKVYWIKEQLMKEGIHYGYTPINDRGDTTDKPSLYQPGAQMLNIIFQHAPSYQRQIERWEPDEGRVIFLFNLDCTLTHYPTGLVVGAGMGGASTGEGRWRDKPPLGVYNSVMKIGAKRSYVAATVSCVGVSEIFTQDIEDLGGDLLPGRRKEKDDLPGVAPSRQRLPQPPKSRLKRSEVEGELEKAAFANGSFWGLVKDHNVWTKEETLGQLLLKLKGEWVTVVLGPKSESKENTYQLFGIEKSQSAPPEKPPVRQTSRTKRR
jgi:hypothetical protein